MLLCGAVDMNNELNKI